MYRLIGAERKVSIYKTLLQKEKRLRTADAAKSAQREQRATC
jgi:hypothetical protein